MPSSVKTNRTPWPSPSRRTSRRTSTASKSGGAMAACSRGAHEAGAHVVGVTVDLFERRSSANRWVKERVHTRDLFERLRTIIGRADGFVAVPGSIGTLTEVFLTWTLLSVGGRPPGPLVLLGGHWKGWLEAHRAPELVPPH